MAYSTKDNRYAVPVAYYVSDDGDVDPTLRTVWAENPCEALEKVKEMITREEMDPDKDESGDEEGYILGDAVKIS